MNILLLCGSVSENSHTRALMRALEKQIQALGATTKFWDLREQPLPIAIPDYHWRVDETPDAKVRSFVTLVRGADAFVLGSPLYHGSMSGVLKNALDHLWYDAFRNKPVALLSHGSSIRRCSQPTEHLQTVVRTMYGYNLQTQIGTTKDDYKTINKVLTLTNPELIDRVERQARELVQLARLFKDRDIEKEDADLGSSNVFRASGTDVTEAAKQLVVMLDKYSDKRNGSLTDKEALRIMDLLHAEIAINQQENVPGFDTLSKRIELVRQDVGNNPIVCVKSLHWYLSKVSGSPVLEEEYPALDLKIAEIKRKLNRMNPEKRVERVFSQLNAVARHMGSTGLGGKAFSRFLHAAAWDQASDPDLSPGLVPNIRALQAALENTLKAVSTQSH